MTDTSKPVKNVTMPSSNDYIAAERIEDTWYQFVHLSPKTDPIARAICDRLDIDWEKILEEEGA